MTFSNARHNRGVLVAPTKSAINQREQEVRDAIEEMAVDTMPEAQGPEDVHVRQLLPGLDLDIGSDNAVDPADQNRWVQATESDGDNVTYEIDSRGRADSKIVAIAGITNRALADEEDGPHTTQVEFETGNGAIIERTNIEGLLTDEEDTALLSDPLIYGYDQNGVIEQHITGDTTMFLDNEGNLQPEDNSTDGETWTAVYADELILHGFVAEKAGNTLEESDRFYSQR